MQETSSGQGLSEETQGMKPQKFRETRGSLGRLSLELSTPEAGGSRKPTEGMDLGYLLNLQMPRPPIS